MMRGKANGEQECGCELKEVCMLEGSMVGRKKR